MNQVLEATGRPNPTSEDLRQHYQGLLRAHGPDHRAVQWSSRSSQEARFNILSEYLLQAESIVDVGSGLGDLLESLRQRGFRGRYHGVDLVPEFIEHARSRFVGQADVSFAEADALEGPLPRADVLVASGLFNNRTRDNWGFLTGVLKNMFEAADRAVVCNAMSSYVDYEDPELYYVDPLALFDFAKRNLTRKVILRHEYVVKPGSVPFEFVLVLFK